MTTRSEVSPHEGAPFIKGDNAMQAALAAFRQAETTTVPATNIGVANIAEALGEYQQDRQAAQAELNELLMIASTVTDPELRAEIYAAHDAARGSLAQGLPAGPALQHARSVRDSAVNGGNIRRNADMDDADKARLAEYIAEQERYLRRLNDQAHDLSEQMAPFNSGEMRERVAEAEAAVDTAKTTEELVVAEANLLQVQREATDEARTNAQATLDADPDNQEAQQAIVAADEMEVNMRERERALEVMVAARYQAQGMEEVDAIAKARADMPALLARQDVQEELEANRDLSERAVAVAVRENTNAQSITEAETAMPQAEAEASGVRPEVALEAAKAAASGAGVGHLASLEVAEASVVETGDMAAPIANQAEEEIALGGVNL